ncbi:centrosomal protein of 170 kDa protein B isoform X2 [Engraulis encrasicolus]|uniref:centrosomal protein of 170 kDa protein B isoform X2 n=1 Tax=Engraulis encrasicolus TaxID=184585 RepID=UPI002FD0CBF6
MSVTLSWFLVSSSGTRHRLPREMIFVGRDDCELMLQSRSVDKQHAVINYDPATDEHLVKDLGSLNGTFVNDLRIPDQTYITLKLSDVIRFGYDAHVYILERSQHLVPEEALKHEKYTSQLQLGVKTSALKKRAHGEEKIRTTMPLNPKLDTSESKPPVTETPVMSKPTPLYGQPSWWGEDVEEPLAADTSDGSQPEQGINSRHSGNPVKAGYLQSSREPSYFEIPTKEFQSFDPKSMTNPQQLQEIPTKDTDAQVVAPPSPSSTLATHPDVQAPVVQSHASFTIEFDDVEPGKMMIKDHVTKFSLRQRHRQGGGGGGGGSGTFSSASTPEATAATAPLEEMSVQSKVADWLVHSSVGMTTTRRKSRSDDMYSTKSDLPTNSKTLKDHQHEDGTLSNSEDSPLMEKHRRQRSTPEPSKHFTPPSSEGHLTSSNTPQSKTRGDPQQAFVIEFFDNNNMRKKRSQSFSNNMGDGGESIPVPKGHMEKKKAAAALQGERGTASQGSIPATQQFTVPLKGGSSTSSSRSFQRAGSLRREKRDVRQSSSANFSSCSASSSSSPRPFGSVGRRSKLAQDFANEFLRQSSAAPVANPAVTNVPGGALSTPSSLSSPTPTTTSSSAPTASSQAAPQKSTSASQSYASTTAQQQLQAANIIKMTPKGVKMPTRGPDPEPVAGRHARNEEDDSLSDAGTYTIEGDAQDKEVQEARSRIDKVFGVVESPSLTRPGSEACGPELSTERGVREMLSNSVSHRDSSSAPTPQGTYPAALSQSPSSCQVKGPVHSSPAPGGPRWVSRWASLADSCLEPNPTSSLFNIPAQLDLSNSGGAQIIHQAMLNRSFDSSESESTVRSRRILPQLPNQDKTDVNYSNVSVQPDPYATYSVRSRGAAKSGHQKGSSQRLSVQDDLDPDSLSDTSTSDNSTSVTEPAEEPSSTRTSKNWSRNCSDTVETKSKSVSSRITSEDSLSMTEGDHQGDTPKFSTATITRQSRRGRTNDNALTSADCRDGTGSKANNQTPIFTRQESYTKIQSGGDDVAAQIRRLPNISSQDDLNDFSRGTSTSTQDTHAYLKETEDVLAVLEAKLHDHGQLQQLSTPSGEDSLSGESDLDSSSTLSQRSSKNSRELSSSLGARMRPASGGGTTTSYNRAQSPLDRVERDREATRSKSTAAWISEKQQQADPSCRGSQPQLHRNVDRHGSMDSPAARHLSNSMMSDPESSSRTSLFRKKSSTPTTTHRDESGKPGDRGKTASQALARSHSLTAPRPTRASMLRRARLGDASDNEGPETERTSNSANELGTTARPAPEAKRPLSRLDMLALPRKRTSSFNTTPSDTEASAAAPTRTGFSNRSAESSTTSARKASLPGDKNQSRKTPVQVVNKPIIRGRSSSAKYASATATGSQVSGAARAHGGHGGQGGQGGHVTPLVGRRAHGAPPGQDSEEDGPPGDAFQNWTSHSAEIARLSQDLAKDLAILAREIHDVAGDSTESSQTHAAPPASQEQDIPDVSQNFKRSASFSVSSRQPEQHHQISEVGGRVQDKGAGDNQLLNPVSQVSLAIRENTEQLTEKLKVLFQNKGQVWEEIETVNSDNDTASQKTGNKEVAAILKELRRVQRQLEVINNIIEPDGRADLTRTASVSTPSLWSARGGGGGGGRVAASHLRDRRPGGASPRSSGDVGREGGGGLRQGGGSKRSSGPSADGSSFLL